jgi:hypothetical protein
VDRSGAQVSPIGATQSFGREVRAEILDHGSLDEMRRSTMIRITLVMMRAVAHSNIKENDL